MPSCQVRHRRTLSAMPTQSPVRRTLVGKPRRTILQDVDDSATLEASFLQQPLHDDIIGMGVDAKVTAPGKCPFDAGTPNTLCAAVARKSMNHTVWAVIQPVAALNLAVCWFNVWADAENERPDNFSAATAYIACPIDDIRTQQRFWRPIRWSPLVRVAMLGHESTCRCINRHHRRQIRLRCPPYLHIADVFQGFSFNSISQ